MLFSSARAMASCSDRYRFPARSSRSIRLEFAVRIGAAFRHRYGWATLLYQGVAEGRLQAARSRTGGESGVLRPRRDRPGP